MYTNCPCLTTFFHLPFSTAASFDIIEVRIKKTGYFEKRLPSLTAYISVSLRKDVSDNEHSLKYNRAPVRVLEHFQCFVAHSYR